MLRSSQDGADRPIALEDSIPPPLYISDTVMRRAITKRSRKETNPAMTRKMRLGQDEREGVPVMMHLGGAAGGDEKVTGASS
jgi:hypothetical protein